MGFLDKLLVAGGVALTGVVAKNAYKSQQETNRRKNSPLKFTDELTPEKFAKIVERIARKTPRVIEARIKGMTVYLKIRSNSGLSTWEAKIDFNDFGNLTGTYWLSSDNEKSVIPTHFAGLVQSEITDLIGYDTSPVLVCLNPRQDNDH